DEQWWRRLISQTADQRSDIVYVIYDRENINNNLIADILIRATDNLVKHGQCIPKPTISLLRNNVQPIRFKSYILLLRNGSQVTRHIVYFDPVKIKYLTTRKDSRKDLVFFCCCKDKNSIRRRFFQCFQKRIESRLREHMHLVNYINLVFTSLWRDTNLFNQATDIVHRVIRRRIQFV